MWLEAELLKVSSLAVVLVFGVEVIDEICH